MRGGDSAAQESFVVKRLGGSEGPKSVAITGLSVDGDKRWLPH